LAHSSHLEWMGGSLHTELWVFFCFGKIMRWLENPIPSFAKLPWYILTLSFDNMQEMTVFQGSRSPIVFKDWKDNYQILDQVPFTVSVFGEFFYHIVWHNVATLWGMSQLRALWGYCCLDFECNGDWSQG
jgi:hypothetical protein